MPTKNFVMPNQVHDDLVSAAYRHRGYTAEESKTAAEFSRLTAKHGIKTHNAHQGPASGRAFRLQGRR